MNRILLAMLLAATPAFAHRHDREYDEDRDDGRSWQHSDDGWGSYGDDRYDWSVPDDDDEGWQPSDGDDSAYAGALGPTYDDFRNDAELSSNGEWIDTPEYGTVWRPRRVREDWQPYVYGRWVWTDAGWAWASDEPFGWAVYHYGRWAWLPAVGWMWVPGRVWAPAWVSWRWTDGYAAWCPMGPRAAVVEQPTLWVVVSTRHFLEPIPHYVVPRQRRRAFAVPSWTAARAGPAVTEIERAVGRTVRPLAIGDARTPASARTGSGSVIFYRPRTAPMAAPPRAGPPVQGPRPIQQRPQAIADRPGWFRGPSPTQPRPQAVPAQQRPPGAPATPPKEAIVPHALPPVAVRPTAGAPHATAPAQRSNPEQAAKER